MSLYFFYIPSTILRYPSHSFGFDLIAYRASCCKMHIAHGSNHSNGAWFHFKINKLFPKNLWYFRMFDFPIQLKSIHSQISEFRFTWMLIVVSLLFLWSIEALITSESILHGRWILSMNLPYAICLIPFFHAHTHSFPTHLLLNIWTGSGKFCP